MMKATGFNLVRLTNENTAVRWTMAPGPLREALGFHYQEFSPAQPLALKGDPCQHFRSRL